MKRFLRGIVNAITELTEVVRFGLEDIEEHFDDLETMLYINATLQDSQREFDLAEEYDNGWQDGYNRALAKMNERAYYEESEELTPIEQEDFVYDTDFLYDQMFST
jgi:hypothetical protein